MPETRITVISSIWITNVLKLSIMPIETAPGPRHADALEEPDLQGDPGRGAGHREGDELHPVLRA